MNPIFSIIIPAKNCEKYIEKCLDSVFKQTFKGEFEIIVCLDPSTDKSENIIRGYMLEHNNLFLLPEFSNGIAYSRLDGVKHSKGKYIAFLDSDDYYHPDFLQTMYDELTNGYDIVNCSFFNDINGKIKKNHLVKNISLNSLKAIGALLSDYYIRSFMPTKVFKRELFFENKLYYPKEKRAIFEDTMLLFTIFMNSKRIRSISKPLYYYRIHSSSMTQKENKDRFDYHLYCFMVMSYLSKQNSNKKYFKVFKKKWFRCYLSLIYDAYVSRHVLKMNPFKIYRLHKKEVKMIKSGNIDIDSLPWKQYFLDCLK